MSSDGSSNPSKAAFQPDSDVHITFEDQEKINRFARHNARFEDFKDELKLKQNEMKNLEDALDELELLDETEEIPFLIGEIFMYQNIENTLKSLDEKKAQVRAYIESIEVQSAKLKVVMADLKAQLYAKFGNHINLEADEE